jgi:hypothetical protein
MHPSSIIPDPGTYERVLQRFDRDPRMAHQQRFASYDVNLRGVAAPSVRGGGDAITMFVPVGKGAAADRAVKVGWCDVTSDWHIALGRTPNPEQVRRLSALDYALGQMEWNALRKYASDRHISTTGKRAEVEARVVEYHHAQVVGS